MKISKLKTAIAEAERFCARAKPVLAKHNQRPSEQAHPSDYLYGSKETGAVRRASMDATRALADLRSRE